MQMNDNILFPFHAVDKNSHVVIYGAGDVGQAFVAQLKTTGYAKVTGWIDRIWADADYLEKPKIKLQDLAALEYDSLVIAIADEYASSKVRESLKDNEVPEEKIVPYIDFHVRYPIYNFATIFLDKNKTKCNVECETKPERMLKVGFLAAGNFAHTMAETIRKRFSDIELCAVAARDLSRAKSFADQYGFKKAYGSYKQLVEDAEIEFVYISSPVALHYEHTMLALTHHKHVLCEKPFAVNEKQAAEMIAYAKEHNLFVSDGVWSAYAPLVKDIQMLLEKKTLGEISSVIANQHWYAADSSRTMDYDMCGGAVLEFGFYEMNFVSMILGNDIKKITTAGKISNNGIDISETYILEYDNAMATINTGIKAISDRRGYIYGSDGYAIVEDAHELKKLTVYDKEGAVISEVSRENGYQFELSACFTAARNGASQTAQRAHENILFAIRVLDKIRMDLGVKYECDR